MSDLGAVTWWLGGLTILVGVQVVALALLAFHGIRLVKRAETALDSVEQKVEPVVAEAKDLIADLRALRETTQRVERSVTNVIDRAGRGVQLAKLGVVRRFWPVFGVVAAGRAIVNRVSKRGVKAPSIQQGGVQGPPPIQ